MRAFWTMDDDDVLMHPRNKVQIPFLIWLYCWTGARIGAFFPKEKEGKKGLRYRVCLYPIVASKAQPLLRISV